MIDIFDAINSGDLNLLDKAILEGANVKAVCDNRHKWTLLHIAAINDYHEIAQALLVNGVDVNAKDKNQRTPFHYAVKNKNFKTTQVLLKSGADSNTMSSNDQSPSDIEFVKEAINGAALLDYHRKNLNHENSNAFKIVLENYYEIIDSELVTTANQNVKKNIQEENQQNIDAMCFPINQGSDLFTQQKLKKKQVKRVVTNEFQSEKRQKLLP